MTKSRKQVSSFGADKEMQMLACKYNCGEHVKVGLDIERVTCWKCVNKMMTGAPVGYNEGISDEEFKRQTES